MSFSFVLSILGQEFSIASGPAEEVVAEEYVSVASDTERFVTGFVAPEYEYEEEE